MVHPIVAGLGETNDAPSRVTMLRHWDANLSDGGQQHSTSVCVILVVNNIGSLEFTSFPVFQSNWLVRMAGNAAVPKENTFVITGHICLSSS